MTAELEIASDIVCPWAYLCVLRLDRVRKELGLDVVMRHLYWPLELVNRRGASRQGMIVETSVLAQCEPDAFAAWRRDDWPSTFLPAFELVKAAEEQGLRAAEALDLALRRAFFREQRNLSLRHVLLDVAGRVPEVDSTALQDAYDSGRTRRVVLAEYDEVNRRGIQGCPEVYLPDGNRVHNPGITWRVQRGIPVIVDQGHGAYGELLKCVVASAQ